MKKITSFFACLVTLSVVEASFSQASQKFNYQGVARGNSGNVFSNQLLGFKLSILQGSATGTPVYEETQVVTSDSKGIFSLEVGGGTVVSGVFSSIGWGANSYYLKTEMDTTGGSNYQTMGTTQILSVPYSLYSETTGDTSMWKKNGNTLYYNSGAVGIGTKTPSNKLHIKDTVQQGGISAFIEGNNQTALYLRTYDTLGAPFKTWVLQNGTEAPYGNSLNLFHHNGTLWTNFIFVVKSGAPPNSLVIGSSGVEIGTTLRVKNGNVLELYNSSNTNWATLRMDTNGWLSENYPIKITGGDVYIQDNTKGIILRSPNGMCWRVTVDNTGNLVRTNIICP